MVENLSARLDDLQEEQNSLLRANRRLWALCVVLATMPLLLSAAWSSRQGEALRQAEGDVLRVRRLEVGTSERLAAVIDVAEGGAGQLRLLGTDGAVRLVVGLDTESRPKIEFREPDGAKRLVLGLESAKAQNEGDTARVWLRDSKGTTSSSLVGLADGESDLVVASAGPGCQIRLHAEAARAGLYVRDSAATLAALSCAGGASSLRFSDRRGRGLYAIPPPRKAE